MLIPEGMTEQGVVDEIERAAQSLGVRFQDRFAGMTRDDVEQQIRTFAIEAVNSGRYDPARPLLAFLLVHCRNRILNLYRNLVRRSDYPCKVCHEGGSCQGSREQCPAYIKWRKRNDSKSRVYAPKVIDVADETRYTVNAQAENQVATNEIAALIDEGLPMDLRADYLRLLSDVHVSISRRILVQSAVLTILEENGLSAEELKICQETRTTQRPRTSVPSAMTTALPMTECEQEERVGMVLMESQSDYSILSTGYGVTSSCPAEPFLETSCESALF